MKNIYSIIFSGIQPTGNLTLGNYIGVLREWVKLQNNNQCIYCITDLHAITTIQNKNNNSSLYDRVLDTIALYLSCGINPDKSIIFVQSHVHEHTELFWLLNCYSYFGELKRMIQFKNKIITYRKNNINAGILNYPILMAADILLYQSNIVPVGQDQLQHLEFTCNIAKRFNKNYGKIFTIPTYHTSKNGYKIKSLVDPTKKMSKSDFNNNGSIFLLEEEKSLYLKIKKAKTDSDNPPIIKYDNKNKPGISNLINIFSCLTNKNIEDIELMFKNSSYNDFKLQVYKEINKLIKNIKIDYLKYRKNEFFLKQILKNGAKKARCIAKITMKKIFECMNIIK
ncbi:tryptophan--tRNA ligase [Buchnera aphidicola (Taiwanaphis decaspermi)]|uniref:tryptophan--tRNA ligase n=1 Tax=Buchnera aphidicola TaxID=9 RepID=UPI0031B88DE8